MKDQMLEAQRNMMTEMAQLLRGTTDKGKAPMTTTEEDNEGHLLGFTPPHVQTQPEAYLRGPSVTIRPQQGQVDAVIPMNFQTSSGFNPGDNLANMVIPDLDVAEREEMRLELSRQLEEHCRWLEEKFRALENADNRQGMDAKDLSLVLDLDSLVGVAARWYNQLSRARIDSWRDLAQAFMQQYNHVTDMIPDRITLQNMEKKPNESFRLYAQRWREIAMQVQPPLLEKETTMLFINTLKTPFITRMIGSTTKNFADIVMAGEIIENAIRGGKIEGEATKRSVSRRKDNKVNNTSSYNSNTVTVSQPRVTTVGQEDSQKQGSVSRQNSEKVSNQISVTYLELYQSLFNAHAIAPFHLKPLQPPYPKWYDPNAKCEYHAGISGHSIENCTCFKKAVEKLIKMGVVKFDDTLSTENPLPNHGDQGVNAVEDTGMRRIKDGVSKVRTLMKMIWEEMVKREMIISKDRNKRARDYCEFYAEEGHEFKALVQSLMDNKELEFYEAGSNEGHICTLEGTPKNQNRPRIIISLLGSNEVETPTDNKRVPWNYNCHVSMPEKEDIASASKEAQGEGSYTRSGKRYDVEGVKVEPAKAKALDKRKGTETLVNELVKEEEAREFLKFLKHSEYSVVEQLRKQPARISVLALLLCSEAHQKALMKVLNETYVTNNISVNKLDRFVSNISADNFIYFNDDEIPPGGMGLAKALHITTRCKGYTVPSVLIDNGSALNVMSLSTLNRLPIDSSHMKACHNVVQAFDGTERRVMGKIDIPLMIGPNTYELVADGRLVTINVEEDIIAIVTSSAPYVEANEEAIECSLHSLEFVNATFIAEGNEVSVPKISRTTRMGLQMTMGRGALPGKGLGRYLQGGIQVPELKEKKDHFGLGFRPDQKQMRREMEKHQEKRRARLSEKEVQWESMTFPHISQTFVSGGIIHPKGGLLEEGGCYIKAVYNEESE
ncbi:uncharacterized protein [Gossypium hirsutum]|uniref:Retrotransposon gag domain-containing protein n=1 Tax=Gossypium hirsutum TaxID=3635 RepID=A0A1U8IDT0_GOSHI|nr:uncharacterized protein LOC107895482 [Gossypium hirsutum]